MACLSFCFLGFIFIGIMLAFTLSCKNSKQMKDFEESLGDDVDSDGTKLKDSYKDIIKQRGMIYLQGIIIGFVIGIITLVLLKTNRQISVGGKVCIFVIVSYGLSVLHYMAVPKSKYMLQLGLNDNQTKKWLEVYKMMKSRQFLGAVIGIIGYIAFSYGIQKI